MGEAELKSMKTALLAKLGKQWQVLGISSRKESEKKM